MAIAPISVSAPIPAGPRPTSTSHLPPSRGQVAEIQPEPEPHTIEAAEKVTATSDLGASEAKKSILIPILVLLVLILCVVGVVIYLTGETERSKQSEKRRALQENIKQNSYIRVGWQRDATETLGKFLAGKTVDEKLPYVLNGKQLKSQIEGFYGGTVINDGDTPLESFSFFNLSEEDRKKGIFMMIYDQPEQFELREFFRPLATLEVQQGLEEADYLLRAFAQPENYKMEPLQVYAIFKKQGDKLLLDWEVFTQTKYRTFQTFTELAVPNSKAVFRILIVEDVPVKGLSMPGMRTYRLGDPANTGDSCRINVVVDSEVGRVLSELNWRGTDTQPTPKTATVELEWSNDPENPVLSISRFICWEFLGVGGKVVPAKKP